MERKAKSKTINSRDSLVVTHPTTSLPAYGLSTAERTGSPVFHTLWSIAKGVGGHMIYNPTFLSVRSMCTRDVLCWSRFADLGWRQYSFYFQERKRNFIFAF